MTMRIDKAGHKTDVAKISNKYFRCRATPEDAHLFNGNNDSVPDEQRGVVHAGKGSVQRALSASGGFTLHGDYCSSQKRLHHDGIHLLRTRSMHRKLCLMYANCQGLELERLLSGSRAFTNEYRIVRRTNYIREPIGPDELASCDLFLYQYLTEDWGELASSVLLAGLSPGAVALRMPNLFFKGYWPFWKGGGPIDFGDSLIDRLLAEGASKPVILRIYLHNDIQAFVDLEASLEETLRREREKEAGAPIQAVDFLLERWTKSMQFHTINHPGKDLLVYVAQQILGTLGMPPLSNEELRAILQGAPFPSYSDFDLPIHPQVAAFYKLPFGGPEQTYAVFGRRMTFAQYISRYIDCHLNGLEDNLLGYLHLV